MLQALIVPVVMLLPLMVVLPFVDKSDLNTTPPVNWMVLELITVLPLMSLMVELEVPLLTDRENPFTVWVSAEMFPSAVVIRELNVSAVCCKEEMFPSAVEILLLSPFTVWEREEMFPSASEILELRLFAVWVSVDTLPSTFDTFVLRLPAVC